ncbi:hypothetical protein ACN28I_07945 [Archangium gephyra]|uniref:hypothetical protein n=1 Tax=Archangium gephyra TaxID=48 RepID=UPI003B7C8158
MPEFDKLVDAFAYHVEAQTWEIFNGDAKTGNKHAKKAIAAFNKLCAHGDAGRDALAMLFTHRSMDVRTSAAAFLLRHRTAEAKAVLEEAAKGKGLIPFEASECLKRWAEGTWALDPAEDDAGGGALPGMTAIKRARTRTRGKGAQGRGRGLRGC